MSFQHARIVRNDLLRNGRIVGIHAGRAVQDVRQGRYATTPRRMVRANT